MSSQQFLSKRIATEFTKNMVGAFSRPNGVEAYRKMIIFRCNMLGMRELDITLGTWARENAHKLNLEECQQFEREVLDHETPDLYYLVLKTELQVELEEYQKHRFIKELREFAFNGLQSV